MQDTRFDNYLAQQQQKKQHMTKAYHESEIKIQIYLAEKIYSVNTGRHWDYKAIRVRHMKKRVHYTHSNVFYYKNYI